MATSKSIFPINLQGPAVRCGLHDKTLNDKRLQIDDAVKFTIEVQREISAQSKWLTAANMAGVVSWSALIVTDIIQNCVKVTPMGNAKIVLALLERAKNEANKNKFDGARYKEQIEKIGKVKDTLKKVLPKGAKDLADLFGDMMQDSLGLAGFAEDAISSRESLDQSIQSSKKTVAKMEALLRKIEARIADDALSDDESAGERAAAVPSSMSPAPAVDFSQSLRLN